MTRERTFRRHNGKEVRLRELTELIAVRLRGKSSARGVKANDGAPFSPDDPPPSRRDISSKLRLKSQTLDRLAPEVPLPEVRAFEDAGWYFLPSADASSAPDQATRAKVFVKHGGRLALSTDRLTLRFKDRPSAREADEILRPFGCRVLEELDYAPGLFRVELTGEARGDALDVANELTASGLCDFAEPELIEALGHR